MKNVVTILFIILNTHCIAQQIYFNNRYDFDNMSDGAHGILKIDTGYLVAGNAVDSMWNYHIVLMLLDDSGNVVWKKSYKQNGTVYFTPGSFIETNDDGYALAGIVFDSLNYAFLMKFNSLGDTSWTHFYRDSTYFIEGWQCKQTSDGGFVIIGVANNEVDVWLIKTDSLGNLQWQKTYGDSSKAELGFSLDVTKDEGYILCGVKYQDTSSYDVYVIKTDSLGNEQWSKTFGGPYWDHSTSILNTLDGGYVFSGYYSYDSIPFSPKRKFWIVKLDSNGATIWDKKYGALSNSLWLWGMSIAKDGEIICAGQTTDSSGHSVGIVVKIGTNGDSIWYRAYDKLKGQNSTNYLRDVKPTNDGGYIAAGFVRPDTSSGDTGTADMWALKVDCMGCEYPNCDSVCILCTEPLIYTIADTFFITDSVAVEFSTNSIFSENWYWDFGDGATDTVQNPVHIYDSAGTYPVILIVTSGNCTDTAVTIIIILNSVGINEHIILKKFLLNAYPNPANESVTIIYKLPENTKKAAIGVYDLAGKELKHFKIKNIQGSLDLDISELANGIYLLSIIANNNTIARDKILVIR
ncbi:MAG: T9SS type A sorting domain-containing protein [Cytophagales bacterium]|nr:T9SS type A sorting domain-containing protein [Cytophagales bacterium]